MKKPINRISGNDSLSCNKCDFIKSKSNTQLNAHQNLVHQSMAITSVMTNINTNETKSMKSFICNKCLYRGVPRAGGEWRGEGKGEISGRDRGERIN